MKTNVEIQNDLVKYTCYGEDIVPTLIGLLLDIRELLVELNEKEDGKEEIKT